MEELEKRTLPEAGIEKERYVLASGKLHNMDADWLNFVEEI